MTGPSISQTCSSTSCTIDGLTNGSEYTFQVIAINEVGESDPSAASAVARPDVRPDKPAQPTVERGDGQLTVTWTPPTNRGSALQSYTVQIYDSSNQAVSSREVAAGTTQTVFSGLENGVNYRFRLLARNLSEEPSEWSEWSQLEHPAGKPKKPASAPTAERVNDPRGGAITVTWAAMGKDRNNGEPITSYVVTSSSGKSQTVKAPKTSATFTGMDADSEHTFTYIAVNSVGEGPESSDRSNAVTPWAKPSPPSNVRASMPSEGEGSGPNGRATVTWDADAASGNGTSITKYVIRGGPSPVSVDASTRSHTFTNLNNGSSYQFTVEARNGFEANGGVSDRSAEIGRAHV